MKRFFTACTLFLIIALVLLPGAKADCMDEYGDHTFSYSSVMATCIAEGSSTRTCTRCGYSETIDRFAKLAHQYADGTCILCGQQDPSYVRETPVIETEVPATPEVTFTPPPATPEATSTPAPAATRKPVKNTPTSSPMPVFSISFVISDQSLFFVAEQPATFENGPVTLNGCFCTQKPGEEVLSLLSGTATINMSSALHSKEEYEMILTFIGGPNPLFTLRTDSFEFVFEPLKDSDPTRLLNLLALDPSALLSEISVLCMPLF